MAKNDPRTPVQLTKTRFKFAVVSHPSLLEFEHEIEARINDGWELSGEMVVTERKFNPKAKHDDTYLQFSQPMIKPFVPDEPAESEA